MKRKGFTLVELLAVIAILAILVIIALPNVMSMFNNAKKSSFETEVKQIYKLSKAQWMNDSLSTSTEEIYSNCKTGCTNPLKNMDSRNDLNYFVKLSGTGKVLNLYVTDGTYQYEYNGNDLNQEEIKDISIIAELDKNKIIKINNNTVIKGDNIVSYVELDTNECVLENNGKKYVSLKKLLLDMSKQNIDYVITDTFSNIRIYSTNHKHIYGEMKNYMRFDDSNKLFRIVGIIDGEVKIIDEKRFGKYEINLNRPSWQNGTYVSSEMDNWPTSSMINELNTTYYNSLTEMEKNAIIEFKWGVNSGATGSVKQIYEKEREARDSNDLNRSMIKKIASMYVSDYYYSGANSTNRWLAFSYNTGFYNSTWSAVVVPTILPLNGHGWIGSQALSNPSVYPVMHISPMTFVTSGDGTKTNPYIIKLDNSIKCK